MSTQHVLIIGAGLIGLFTAWWLRSHGTEVTILERGEPGREASWAGGGILAPLCPWRYPEPVWTLADWSIRRYPDLIRSLSESTGINPQFCPSGLVMLEEAGAEARRWTGKHGRGIEAW